MSGEECIDTFKYQPRSMEERVGWEWYNAGRK